MTYCETVSWGCLRSLSNHVRNADQNALLSASTPCCSLRTKHREDRSILKLVGNRRNLCFAVSLTFHSSPSFTLGRASVKLPMIAQPTQHYAAFCNKPSANFAPLLLSIILLLDLHSSAIAYRALCHPYMSQCLYALLIWRSNLICKRFIFLHVKSEQIGEVDHSIA